MKVSVIIPTHKHLSDCLKPCIESIIKNTDLSDAVVIVVANGCGNDGTKEYVESLGESFKLLWSDEALGYTKSTNWGIAASSGEIIILLNNDIVLLDWQKKNEWLDRLCKPLKDPVIGVTGPLALHEPAIDKGFIIFMCAAFRRDLYDNIGPLDETFSPGGYEDADYCLRAEQFGYQNLVIASRKGVDSVQKLVVTDFPIYHFGEKTMLDEEHAEAWHKIVEKNKKILGDRYRLPEGMFYVEDVVEYRKLLNEVPEGGTICELGVWKGKSLCSVADIIKRRKLSVMAVDTFVGAVNEPEQMALAMKDDILKEFHISMERFGLAPSIYQMTTVFAANEIDDRSLDFCFIDANHSYESVKQDIEVWEPKVKRGGIIGGHDYSGTAWPGVRKAVDEKYREVYCNMPSTVWSRKVL